MTSHRHPMWDAMESGPPTPDDPLARAQSDVIRRRAAGGGGVLPTGITLTALEPYGRHALSLNWAYRRWPDTPYPIAFRVINLHGAAFGQ